MAYQKITTHGTGIMRKRTGPETGPDAPDAPETGLVRRRHAVAKSCKTMALALPQSYPSRFLAHPAHPAHPFR